jgi:hypothetical protein
VRRTQWHVMEEVTVHGSTGVGERRGTAVKACGGTSWSRGSARRRRKVRRRPRRGLRELRRCGKATARRGEATAWRGKEKAQARRCSVSRRERARARSGGVRRARKRMKEKPDRNKKVI